MNKITIVTLGIIERCLKSLLCNMFCFFGGLIVGIGCVTFILKTNVCKYADNELLRVYERIEHIANELQEVKGEMYHDLIYHTSNLNKLVEKEKLHEKINH